MTEMFGEAWSPMSVPDLAPDDDDESEIGNIFSNYLQCFTYKEVSHSAQVYSTADHATDGF